MTKMKRFYKTPLLVLLLVQPFMVRMAFFTSNITDQLALLAFKSAIKFDPNNVLGSNWTENTNFCNWVGVLCSPHRQRVTGLRLPSKGLQGTISPHIGNLSFLMRLNLGNNSFHGHLIEELSRLRRLTVLILDKNHFEGMIPPSLHHCRRLQVMSMPFNRLTGGIPSELSTLPWLRLIFLGRNNLTSTIPPSLGNMSSLVALGLEQNKLHGNIPAEIGNLPSTTGRWLPNLELLNLGGNLLSGNIPLYLSNLSSLIHLYIPGNQFSGTVPMSLGQLELLIDLNLENNQLTLEPGSLEISFLTALTNLRSLETLIIDNNPFNGILPDSIGNLSSSLQMFFAPCCQIKGRIPEGIGSMGNLTYLVLSDNNLNGTIPSTIGEATKELCRETNNFCESNLLGVGGFGSVYKGILSDGAIVAVKILNLQMEGAFKSFDAECHVLRTVRHQNLVKVISSCSNLELRALVLQYMAMEVLRSGCILTTTAWISYKE
ncbi:hypothetical protein F0562_030556 [Nyssa sinensis]|uniref:Protein kinase domain-containing protein n=1 Tax=Nyssa sinensis TaxID=561372 RepID=A0A5J5AZ56_9ASTE|nr:hypothetical protein F0562_030556 [Nyssa sinensis]